MRPNPKIRIETAISELGVGEALISLLDAKGTPSITERAFVLPPSSRLGPATAEERRQTIAESPVAGHYEKVVDRESAYERLKGKSGTQAQAGSAGGAQAGAPAGAEAPGAGGGLLGSLGDLFGGGQSTSRRGSSSQSVVETAVKSVARQVGSELGRQLVRGVLGSLLGGSSGSRRR